MAKKVSTTYEDAEEMYGMPGTVVPSSKPAKDGGGSFGYDPTKKLKVNVDPGLYDNTPGWEYEEDSPPTSVEKLKDKELVELGEEEPKPKPKPKPKSKAKPKEVKEAPPEGVQVAPTEEIPKPETRVLFNLGDTVGSFECYYHRVFRDGPSVVLVWDARYKGTKFIPPASTDNAIQVEIGSERQKLGVYVGPKYFDEHHQEEVLVLFIV